ncbi:MAG TPA: CopD family protein, partial [bacterium]|nr:CopD family protein [bacterium]
WSLLVRLFMTGVLLVPSRGPWRILRPAALVWFVGGTAVIAVLGGPGALRGSHVTLIVLVGTVYGLVSVIAAIILPQIPDLRIPQWGLTRPIAAVLLLWGFTLTSHAVAGGAVAVALDWLHLLAAAVWLGGLPALLATFRAIAARDRAAAARVLVPRVSRLALGALIVMAVTGLAAARRTVPALEALATSLYGRTLLVKLALVLLVATLGAINRFVLRPRIAAGRAGALDAFRRSVAAEVALGALVLLAVGVLTTVPPAAVNRQASAPPLVLAGLAGPWHVRLEIAPPRPGWSEARVEITGLEDARPVAGAAVQMVLTALDHAEDRAVALQPRAAGYAASGDLLSAGWWEVTIVVRAGGREARTSFPLIVGADRAPAPSGQARALFEAVRSRMRAVRTWRETEQITDGAGGVALTRFEAQAPDRLAFRTSGGTEAVIVRAVRYSRERGGPWTKDTLPQPIALAGPLSDFFEGAEGIRLGREAMCPDEPCCVLLWDLPRAQARIAARAGERSRTVRMLWMVAPGHHMTSRPQDLGAPVRIVPPQR